jgi:hypothetical protein
MRLVRKHSVMRVVASVLATVALAGQVTSFAHLVLVRHVTCAEHGELVEVGKTHVVARPAHGPSQPIDAFVAAAAADEHGHEHCLIAPMRRDRIAAGAPESFDSAHIDAYGTVGVIVADEVTPPIAVILLAPKNSPPVA